MDAVRQDENALPASAIITGAAAARWYYRHYFRLTCRHGFRCRSMPTRFQKGRQSSFLPSLSIGNPAREYPSGAHRESKTDLLRFHGCCLCIRWLPGVSILAIYDISPLVTGKQAGSRFFIPVIVIGIRLRCRRAASKQQQDKNGGHQTNRFPLGQHLELHPHAGHEGIDIIEIRSIAIQAVEPVSQVGLGAPFLDILHHLKTEGVRIVAVCTDIRIAAEIH